MPAPNAAGTVDHLGASLWYGHYGAGPPVVLLHGGLGNSENWFKQIPALCEAGFSVIAIDSRGHGRSTRDERPFTYTLMASDVLAVMDRVKVAQTAVVGWSDGAIVGLTLAMNHSKRITRVFAFAANMDPSGNKPVADADKPIVAHILARHAKDYARLSQTPAEFGAFSKAVAQMMATAPNYRADDLARIQVPVAIASGEYDEFLHRDHLDYLARTIPGARPVLIAGASHFAPLQRPDQFNSALLSFLNDG